MFKFEFKSKQFKFIKDLTNEKVFCYFLLAVGRKPVNTYTGIAGLPLSSSVHDPVEAQLPTPAWPSKPAAAVQLGHQARTHLAGQNRLDSRPCPLSTR
jgi:hypothetical protein